MSRRRFIKACALSGFGLLVGCRANAPKTQYNLSPENEIIVNRTEFTKSKYVVVEHPNSRYPIGIFQTNENEFVASLMECTHQSCQLSMKGDAYICPCHGSRFDVYGSVTKGPAEESLETYTIRVTDTRILIKLNGR